MLHDIAIEPAVSQLIKEEKRGSWLKRNFLSAMGVGQVASWGTLYYSFPLIAEAMGKDLHLSKSQAYGAVTIGLLASMFFAYPIGRMIDRGAGRNVMAAGSLAAALVLIAWSRLTTGWPLYPLFTLMGIAQSMTLYEAAFAVIAKLHPSDVRRSITIVTLWGGFASTVFVPLIQFFLNEINWRHTLIVLGFINIIVAALYSKTISKEDLIREKPFNVKDVPKSKSIRIAIESKSFWGLLVSFTMYSLLSVGLSFHLYPILTERHLSTAAVVSIIGLLGPAQVIGRLILWAIAKWIPGSTTGRLALLLFPISLIFAICMGGILPLILFLVIYGIGNGTMSVIRATSAIEISATKEYGTINSLIQIPSTLAKALAPFAIAFLFDFDKSYEIVLSCLLLGTIPVIAGYWFAVGSCGSSMSSKSAGAFV